MKKSIVPSGLCLLFFAACSQAPKPSGTTVQCSSFLRKVPTSTYLPESSTNLCDLSLRYHRVRYQLVRKGVSNPDLIANVFGPRFIERADWEQVLEKSQGPVVNPAEIYEPAPETWDTWARAAINVMIRANQNLATQVLPLYSLEQIQELNARSSLGPSSGALRQASQEIGRAMEKRYAIDDKQVKAIEGFEIPELIGWRNTQCLEERPASFQKKYRKDLYHYSDPALWPVTKNPDQAYEADGKRHRCGYITYPDAPALPKLLDRWIQETNSQIGSLATSTKPQDPILLAARAQRWLVAIHPFDGGNGRTSRLVMDEVLMSLGLPAPILREMNHDLGHTEEEWAREVGSGIVRALEALEACEKDLTAKGCNEVTFTNVPEKTSSSRKR